MPVIRTFLEYGKTMQTGHEIGGRFTERVLQFGSKRQNKGHLSSLVSDKLQVACDEFSAIEIIECTVTVMRNAP